MSRAHQAKVHMSASTDLAQPLTPREPVARGLKPLALTHSFQMIDLNKSANRAKRRSVSLTRLGDGSSLVVSKTHLEISALEVVTTQLLDSSRGICLRPHLDEARASRIPIVVVKKSAPHRVKLELSEQVEQVLLVRRILQIGDEARRAL